jgi:hypothetical protein
MGLGSWNKCHFKCLPSCPHLSTRTLKLNNNFQILGLTFDLMIFIQQMKHTRHSSSNQLIVNISGS